LHAQIKCIFNAPPFDQAARRRTAENRIPYKDERRKTQGKRRKTIIPTSEERAGNADKVDVIEV
jgi:hypothetical protein